MCISPIVLKKATIKRQFQDSFTMEKVPCGKCIECRKARVNSWYARLSQELKTSSSAYFLTLTYTDDALPFSDNGLMTLRYSDFQLFMKRLRKDHHKTSFKKLKYYCAGEYGTQTHRPHYHVLMFNLKDVTLALKHWSPYGFVSVGNVEDASIFYTLKYTLKKSFSVFDSSDSDDDRVKERGLMSKGLGISFVYNRDFVKYYNDDPSRQFPILGGTSIPLPRYYRDKMLSQTQKNVRLEKMEPFLEKRYAQESDKMFSKRVKKMMSDSLKNLLKTN